MLSIKGPKPGWGRGEWVEDWHVGEPVPKEMLARVVTVQLDGHELEMLLRAMEGTRVSLPRRITQVPEKL